MSHGNWIKKTALFFCCTTTMLSLRLVIGTAGFCVVRFHLDYSYLDIFTSRLLNAALLAHQIGNWLGVVTISAAAATTNAAIKVYALAAANWLYMAAMCVALIFFCAGEDGSLTSFYWSMAVANLFQKTSHAICFEIAPCYEHSNNGCSGSDCKADATNYCVASFVASTVIISLMKVDLFGLVADAEVWKRFSVHSRHLGHVSVTILGRRSVKTTVDYRSTKIMMTVILLLTFLMCVVWSLIVCSGQNQDQEFECNWNTNHWQTRVVCGILGIVPGSVLAAVSGVLFWCVVWEVYKAGRTRFGRGFKWGILFVCVAVALSVVLVYRRRRRPKFDDSDCSNLQRRSPRKARSLKYGRYDKVSGGLKKRQVESQYVLSRLMTEMEPNLDTVQAKINISSDILNEHEQKFKSIGQKRGGLDKLQKGYQRRRPRSSSPNLLLVPESRLKDIVSFVFLDKWNDWWRSERPSVVKEVGHSIDDAVKKVNAAVQQVENTLQKVNAAADKVEKTSQTVESAVKFVTESMTAVRQVLSDTSSARDAARDAARFAEYTWRQAQSSGHYAKKAKDSAKKAEQYSEEANRTAGKAEKSADGALLLTLLAEDSAKRSAQSSSNAEKSAALSALTSGAAFGTASAAVLASAAAVGTSNMAALTSGAAFGTASAAVLASAAAVGTSNMAALASGAAFGTASAAVLASAAAVGTSNMAALVSASSINTSTFAMNTANTAMQQVSCGIKWMREKFIEIFGIQEDNEGRRWIVMIVWGVVGIVIVVIVVGIIDAERDWMTGISEEDVRATCNTAALIGGGLGMMGGVALGAFAKELQLTLGKEQYTIVYNEQNLIVKDLGTILGLGVGSSAGAAVGLIVGAIIEAHFRGEMPDGVYSRLLGRVTVTVPGRHVKLSDGTKTKQSLWAVMGLGALVGSAVGILVGLGYKEAVDAHAWPQQGAVGASLGMNILGLGTVYSVYPGMAPCSITHFLYFNRIDIWILTLSCFPPIAITCVSEISEYGPEQKWDTEKISGMLAWYGGLGPVAAQFICQIIVIYVLQHPGSKLARQITSSPVRSGILTVTIVTCGHISAAIGYPGVVGNSGCNSATIILNNTATLAMMQCTAVLGEGYLTELKKYEPGQWPTQGMGRHKAFNWWCGKACRNAWAIWCCIGTTDLRRDIMLCRQ